MIALFGKTLHPQNVIFVQEIIDYLTKLGLPFAIEKNYGELIKDRVNFACETFSDFDEVRSKTEILISLGGDGTILEALTFIKNTQTPILGINFGRLGFLANVGKEQIHQAIDIVARGKYLIDKRRFYRLVSS